MKKFEFRLGTVLRWRDTQLQLERAKLQKLLSEKEAKQRSLQSLLDERQAASSAFAASEQLETSDLRAWSAYLLGVDGRAGLLREQMNRLADLIRQQQERLLQAERNVRLLEELQDNRYAEWKSELDREVELASEESWLAANFRTADSEL